MKPRKGLVITSSILNIVLAVGMFFISAYILLFFSKLGSALLLPIAAQIELVFITIMIADVAAIILSSILLKRCNNPTKKFGRGLAITLFVFDLIFAIDMTLLIISKDVFALYGIIAGVLYLLCAVFLIISISHNSKIISSLGNINQENTTQTATKSLQSELENLNKLKADGLVNEEEFNSLKASLLEKFSEKK